MDATPDQQAWTMFFAGFMAYVVLYVMALPVRLSVDSFRVIFGGKDASKARRRKVEAD